MSARPEFLQLSPTVYGFDFNALAGVGGTVPDSHSAPVVKHGSVRTGNDPRPNIGGLEVGFQPRQPPAGHTPPGYPWQGHPQIAYSQPFLGPDGTSPQTRSGPNIGAHAAAPPDPLAFTGAGYPYAAAGTYVPVPGQMPNPGALAGLNTEDYGGKAERKARRAARKADRNQRDAWGDNRRYLYRQFSDGAIKILVSGDPRKLPVGSVLKPGTPGWSAITAEIGTWADYAASRGIANISAATTGLSAFTQMYGKKKRKKRRRKLPPGDFPVPEEEPGLPKWVPLAAIGGAVLLLVIVAGGKK